MNAAIVHPSPTWRARPREVAPAIGETLAALDAAETAVVRAEEYESSTKNGVRNGIATALVGLLAGTAAVVCLAGTAAAAPIVVTAGVVVIAGSVVAGSNPSEKREAREMVREKVNDAALLYQKLDDLCAQERPLNEQSLRNAGGGDVALMEHVSSDPYVVVSAARYGHASDRVARNRTLLAGSREDRFAAEPARVDEIWQDRAGLQGLTGLLGMVGTLWTGMCVGAVVGSPYVMLASLVGIGCEWLALKHYGRALVTPAVDRQLTRELAAEQALYEPKLEALREARDTSRRSALEHYARVATGPTQPPGEVRVEDDRVVIDGVSVPRS